MAIAHEGTTTKSATSASDTFTLPATATTGRLIVLGVKVASSSVTSITATGFTSYTFVPYVLGPYAGAILYKVAIAGDASSNITIAWGGANAEHAIICSVYSGVDTTTPTVTAPTATSGTMSTTALTTPAVTMTQANSYYWGMVSANINTTYTSAVLTERADFQIQTLNSSQWAGDQAIAATGTTGTKAVTAAASTSSWWGTAIGINPAAVGGGATSLIWDCVGPIHRLLRSM